MSPTSCEFNPDTGAYVAQWARGALQGGAVYRMQLRSGLVNDSAGREFSLPASAVTYTMGYAACSGRGVPVPGYPCNCDEGYAGDDCEQCADGYVPGESASSSQLFCRPAGDTTEPGACSKVDVCGCEPGSSPCKPLGVCRVVSGHEETCACTGDHLDADKMCKACLAPYTNFPACDRTADDGTTKPATKPATTRPGETTRPQPATTKPQDTSPTTPPSKPPTMLYLAIGGGALVLVVVAVVVWRFCGARSQSNYGQLPAGIDDAEVDDERDWARDRASKIGAQEPDDEEGQVDRKSGTVTLGKSPSNGKKKESNGDEFDPRSKDSDKIFQL